MEPKNESLEDVFPFQLGDFQGVMFESAVITRNPFSYQFVSSLKINFLDVPGRKLGSMVIGSVGYFTPIHPPFISRWNNPLIRSPLILTSNGTSK